MIHNPADLPLIRSVLDDFRPYVAVEFGTYAGGFAAFLASILNGWGGHVLTVDHEQDAEVLTQLEASYLNLTLIEHDLLGEASHDVLTWFLAQPRALLYCDNGRKLDELTRYAPTLARPGCVGVHDYNVEVMAADAEPLMTSLGYAPHRHAEFAGEYPRGLTRFWIRV